MIQPPKRVLSCRQFEDDPKKAESRQYLLGLAKTYFERADPRILTAAFFTGPSLIEYDQVYKPLGMEPKNVYGIERDAEAFRAASAQNEARPETERINIVHSTDTEFFKSSSRGFNIVSLDYLQNYGPDIIRSLDALFDPDRPLLRPRCILAINLQARREALKHQWRLALFNIYAHCLGISEIELHSRNMALCGSRSQSFQRLLERRRMMLETASNFACGLEGSAMGVPRLESLVPWARAGIFEEVFIRAQYAGLRSIAIEDIERTLLAHPKLAGRSPVHFDSARALLSRIEPLFVDHGSLHDSLKLALLGSYFIETLYAAYFMKHAGEAMMPSGGAGNSEELILGGYISNRVLSSSLYGYINKNYTSQSGTPMSMHIFRVERNTNRSINDFLQIEETFSRRIFMGPYAVMRKIYFSDEPRYAALRGACLSYYKREFTMNDVFGDMNLWARYRAGKELQNSMARLARVSEPRDIRAMMSIFSRIPDAIDLRWKIIEEHGMELSAILRAMEGDANAAHVRALNGIFGPKTPAANDNREEPPGQKGVCAPAGGAGGHDAPAQRPAAARLSASDKECIRELAKEGYTPEEIHKVLFEGTDVRRAQIAAICAWNKIYAKRNGEGEGAPAP